MAVLTTVQQAVNIVSSGQKLAFQKASTNVSTPVVSSWQLGGIPAAGSSPGVLAGAIPTNSTTGAFPLVNNTNNYLVNFTGVANNINTNSYLILYDRLWHNSEMSGTVTTDTTLGSTATINRATSLANELWCEQYTSIGGNNTVLTVKYTNQDNVSGRLATMTKSGSTFHTNQCTLEGNDIQVKSVQSYSWDTANASAGNFGLFIARRIAAIPLVSSIGNGFNNQLIADFFKCAVPNIDDNACLFFIIMQPTSGGIQGSMTIGTA